MLRALLFVSLLVAQLAVKPALAVPFGLCDFDRSALSFAGDAGQQAACLLRKVKPFGAASEPQPIPKAIAARVGKAVDITPGDLRRFLAAQGIEETDLGGDLDRPLVSALRDDGTLVPARYFVIHDTSAPELGAGPDFPPDIDSAGRHGNRITGKAWARMGRLVNVIVNRLGESRSFRDFGLMRRGSAIKLEFKKHAGNGVRGLFLHCENVQPRLKPAGAGYHYKAPDPGLTEPQMERLALVYIAASVRRGDWLIPAFHFNIDFGIPDAGHAHDDPQNFSLETWAAKIEQLMAAIRQA